MTWTERILEFPVRAAAVDDFLRELNLQEFCGELEEAAEAVVINEEESETHADS